MLIVGWFNYCLASIVDIDVVAQDHKGKHDDYDLEYPKEALIAYEVFLLVVNFFVVGFVSHDFWAAGVL